MRQLRHKRHGLIKVGEVEQEHALDRAGAHELNEPLHLGVTLWLRQSLLPHDLLGRGKRLAERSDVLDHAHHRRHRKAWKLPKQVDHLESKHLSVGGSVLEGKVQKLGEVALNVGTRAKVLGVHAFSAQRHALVLATQVEAGRCQLHRNQKAIHEENFARFHGLVDKSQMRIGLVPAHARQAEHAHLVSEEEGSAAQLLAAAPHRLARKLRGLVQAAVPPSEHRARPVQEWVLWRAGQGGHKQIPSTGHIGFEVEVEHGEGDGGWHCPCAQASLSALCQAVLPPLPVHDKTGQTEQWPEAAGQQGGGQPEEAYAEADAAAEVIGVDDAIERLNSVIHTVGVSALASAVPMLSLARGVVASARGCRGGRRRGSRKTGGRSHDVLQAAVRLPTLPEVVERTNPRTEQPLQKAAEKQQLRGNDLVGDAARAPFPASGVEDALGLAHQLECQGRVLVPRRDEDPHESAFGESRGMPRLCPSERLEQSGSASQVEIPNRNHSTLVDFSSTTVWDSAVGRRRQELACRGLLRSLIPHCRHGPIVVARPDIGTRGRCQGIRQVVQIDDIGRALRRDAVGADGEHVRMRARRAPAQRRHWKSPVRRPELVGDHRPIVLRVGQGHARGRGPDAQHHGGRRRGRRL
mmetsp:Transcript_156147/g.500875  ORF Transcript_156147/g.500875 Transcript_156147/m.500875 type:complete len:636 (-) Transcript_156147:689-2596(-)